MQRGHVDLRYGRLLHPAVEDLGHACQQVLLLLLDLVRMHVELLGEFRHRLFSADGRQRHLRLKSRTMVSA